MDYIKVDLFDKRKELSRKKDIILFIEIIILIILSIYFISKYESDKKLVNESYSEYVKMENIEQKLDLEIYELKKKTKIQNKVQEEYRSLKNVMQKMRENNYTGTGFFNLLESGLQKEDIKVIKMSFSKEESNVNFEFKNKDNFMKFMSRLNKIFGNADLIEVDDNKASVKIR